MIFFIHNVAKCWPILNIFFGYEFSKEFHLSHHTLTNVPTLHYNEIMKCKKKSKLVKF